MTSIARTALLAGIPLTTNASTAGIPGFLNPLQVFSSIYTNNPFTASGASMPGICRASFPILSSSRHHLHSSTSASAPLHSVPSSLPSSVNSSLVHQQEANLGYLSHDQSLGHLNSLSNGISNSFGHHLDSSSGVTTTSSSAHHSHPNASVSPDFLPCNGQ